MAKTLQFRRGTTAELASVTGAEAELFVDITKDTVVVMDGATPGGKALATEEFVLANAGTGGSVGGDAVFDSALIGNVAIISNEVTGIDSYGNNAVLNLSGETVNISPVVALTSSTTTSYVNGSGISIDNMYHSGVTPKQFHIYLYDSTSAILESLQTGDVLIAQYDTGGGLYQDYTLTLETPFTYISSGHYSATVVEQNTSGTDKYMTNPYPLPILSITQYTSSTDAASYAFAANGTLGVNQDFNIAANSTSIVTTPVTIDMMAPSLTWSFDSMSGKSYFGFIGSSDSQYAPYFKAGMTVNCFVDNQPGKGNAFTLTLKTDMAINSYIGAGSYIAETVEVKANDGMSTYIYKSDISTTVTSGATANYNFDTTGTFTTASVLADSALIGDVSIVGNTIAGVDSYGLADTLVVDSNLEVKGVLTAPGLLTNNVDGSKSVIIDTETITVYAGEMMNPSATDKVYWSNTQWLWQNPKQVSFSNPNSFLLNILTSLNPGDIIKFANYNMGSMSWNYYNLTFVSYDGYSMSYNGYIINVEESNPFVLSMNSIEFQSSQGITVTSGATANYNFGNDGALSAPSLLTDSALIGDVSIVGNTIAGVDSYGLADTLVVDSNLEVKGVLQLPSAGAVPSNTSTVVSWAKISIGGQTYYTPLYQ